MGLNRFPSGVVRPDREILRGSVAAVHETSLIFALRRRRRRGIVDQDGHFAELLLCLVREKEAFDFP
jgi:hypothetical protein